MLCSAWAPPSQWHRRVTTSSWVILSGWQSATGAYEILRCWKAVVLRVIVRVWSVFETEILKFYGFQTIDTVWRHDVTKRLPNVRRLWWFNASCYESCSIGNWTASVGSCQEWKDASVRYTETYLAIIINGAIDNTSCACRINAKSLKTHVLWLLSRMFCGYSQACWMHLYWLDIPFRSISVANVLFL